ncbi:polymorphic toxin-type HINT domain-containing protein [Streptomyces sp. ME02-8801-2C]|uniref:polymorphic toxin-type HINT domain-containing protein n=1 Tax=Streptomyces sp. ME02-8801-2C TaxID=3028680 RepID=UPI0029B9EE46|nr:polymorphic toxin-type HINT domain-containing protein [Streptomyces sp. ME02-8801-2C]MDX3457245.1 polymorphic toxin-type HINT domain-containing protein [Streptomyces sp. ME02-8801-2C]
MKRQQWQRARRRTALALSAVLVGTLVQAVTSEPAVAADPSKERPAITEADKPLAGHDRKASPRRVTTATRTPKGDPAAAWPASGEATAAVPAMRTTARGTAIRERVAKLPVALRAPKLPKSAKPTTDRVTQARVRILGRATARHVGVDDGMLVAVDRADQSTRAGKVGLEIDYARFTEAYGGGYGSRLGLVQLPPCALTTPDRQSCRTGAPVKSVNDTEHHTLTADAISVPGRSSVASASARSTVLAVTAEASGSTGDYKATSLSPSATWRTGLNTGDFSWSYGMNVPDVPGSLVPGVGLSYSSGSIDGRTTTSNNQSSWVGDGFDMWPGYIERSYKSCDDDGITIDGNKSGDLCWGYDNATLSFNGRGGELIQATGNKWRLKNDDGTRVEKLTGTTADPRNNGDDNQEFWKVTTTDGTQYFFGYHQLPGWSSGKETTDSTWTVPVYGDDTDEPCHASTFAGSWCQQAWRWNLDYVVDVHGNAITYYYDKETNNYGRALKAADDTPYVRGGTLDRIEYGLRKDAVYSAKALAKVDFTSTERCLPVTGVTCLANTIDDKSFYWYDTPWDLNCKAATDCTGHYSPTFWTRQRLSQVLTQTLNSSGTYTNVDSWDLTQRWGMADIDYSLLLDSIQHTGRSATPVISLPKVTFDYHQDANRLDKQGDGTAPFIKHRLSTVIDESGGQIDINYTAAPCSWDNEPTMESNTTRCYPLYYTASGDAEPSLQWFNKYVVDSVTQTDRTKQSPDMITRYSYLDGAAWHYDDDDGLTKEKYKTWSQWRGYRHVRVQTGGTSGMKTQADHYFVRGMQGDRSSKAGGVKTVTLDDGEGGTLTDAEALLGFEYRTENFSGPGGKILSKTVNHGWFRVTATRIRLWGSTSANFSGGDSSRTFTSLDNGEGSKWRETRTDTTYDNATGRPLQVEDLGQTGVATDNRCTRTTYADNDSANLYSLVSRVETVSVDCGTNPERATQVISDVRTAYDGSDYAAMPSMGEPRFIATLKSHDGTSAKYLESGSTYDTYGRAVTSTDLTADITVSGSGTLARTPRAGGRTTTTAYTPTTGIPTGSKVTSPPAKSSDSTTAQTVTTTLDPVRGAPTAVLDTNNKRTNLTYDALGRSLKVWLPNRSKDNSETPNYEFTYNITDNAVVVGTKTLNNNGSQQISYALYDGFLRPTQTQAPGPDGGRLIADTFYDERGLTAKSFATYYATGAPVAAPFQLDDALSVETQTWFSYDGLGREIQRKSVAGNGDGGSVLSTTTTAYGGDRVTVTPPNGAPATTTVSDAQGQTRELWQYRGNTPEGAHDVTAYEYTPAGQLAKATDPVGNKWTYKYDQLGRTILTTDPDKGTVDSAYDDRGQLVSVLDDNETKLVYAYDDIGRKTELRNGSATGPLLAKWTYDTLAGAEGQLVSTTRYDGANEYTSTVNSYDGLYRPTRITTTIPAVEKELQGSYQQNFTYNLDGTPAGVSYAAAGSLPGESFTYTYDANHRPIKATGTSTYLTDVKYSFTGKPQQIELAATGGKHTWLSNTYEWGTQRLATSRVDREEVAGVDRSTTYGYDEIGNVLAISDTSRDGTDNQCFSYDYLRRLTEAWAQGSTGCATSPSASILGGPAPYWHSYTYDKEANGASIGNRATETQHAPNGDTAKDVKRIYTYPSAGAVRPHTLGQIDTTGPNGSTARDTYTYDNTGNTVTRAVGGTTQQLSWDAEDHLAKVTEPDGSGGKKTTSYLYDPNGNRLIQRTDAETTLYLGNSELVLPKGATKAKATRYYDLGNGVQAIRTDDNKVSFVIPDHQGTGQLAVDASTLALLQRRTTPFGGQRGLAGSPGSWPGSKGFVGGTVDKTTGLTHLSAREYDPSTGRFLSVDPIMDLTDPQQINGYSYSSNSPVTFADPSGLRAAECDGGWKKCGAGGAINNPGSKKAPQVVASGSGNGGSGSGRVGTAKDGQPVIDGIRIPTRKENVARFALMDPRHTTDDEYLAAFAQDTCMRDEYAKSFCASARQAGLLPASGNDPWGVMATIHCITGHGDCKEAIVAGVTTLLTVGWGSVGKGLLARGATRTVAKEAEESALQVMLKGACSFSPSTPVLLADGKTKPIGKVKPGDKVAAADPQTGKYEGKRAVTAQLIHRDDDLVDVAIRSADGRISTLRTTADHPFWDDTEGAWVPAASLEVGHTLNTDTNAHAPVVDVKARIGAADMYNLTVEELHTYYVLAGDTPILVHNSGGLGPGQIHLWRGVTANELADISANRTWNSPQGVKYFSFTEKGAAEYSRRAYAAYPKEGPYTMIRTTVNVADLPEGARMAYTADVIDGGVALNNSELKILGRPSIMTGMSC